MSNVNMRNVVVYCIYAVQNQRVVSLVYYTWGQKGNEIYGRQLLPFWNS